MPMWLVQIIFGVVLSVVSSMLSASNKSKAKASGIRSQVTIGGDEPLSFIVGRYGTAGHLEYAGTWGQSGDVPNAYYTLVRSVSDLPVRGFRRFAIYGQWVTLDATHTDKGYAVLEYRRKGKDYLWIDFHDGTQTSANSFLLSAFASDPDHPWTSDMIGRGIAYFTVTAKFNRDLFTSPPEPFTEVDGFDLDDPRGDDEQENPVVGIRQVLKGFYFGDEWVWGLQGLPDSRTPALVWEPQMDKCDGSVALAGGGTEKRFRFGAEIRVDEQPIEVITTMLDACNGRIAEVGGIYKIHVAEPGDPVVSFIDDDIVITEGQSFDPFPGLESTYNAISATYVEPGETWATKQAPILTDLDYEAADDGRRLPADVALPYVFSGTQVQRIQKAMLLEDRRWRTHTMTLPPEWWEYEVLDVAAWTSSRNGYASKAMLIAAMDDLPGGNQVVKLREQDPADFGWNAATDEHAYSVVPLVVSRPTPQVTTGFTVAPYTVEDSASAPRRAGIEVFWDAGLVDVRSVRIQVREGWGDKAVVADVTLDYDVDEAAPSRVIANPAILPASAYEVRGIYLPFSGRVTRWSNQDVDGIDGAWLTVTTPDVQEVTSQQIIAATADLLAYMNVSLRDLNENVQLASSLAADQDAANFDDRRYVLEQVKIGDIATYAASTRSLLLALGADGSSLADAISAIEAASGDVTAGFLTRMTTVASPDEAWVRYGMQLRASLGDDLVMASDFWEVNAATGASRHISIASEHYILDDEGNVLALFGAGGATFDVARIEDASIGAAKIADAAIGSAKIGDAAVTTAKIDTAAVTSAKIGSLQVERIKIANAAVTELLSDTVTAGTVSASSAYQTICSISIASGAYPIPVGAYLDFQPYSGSVNQPYETLMEIIIDGASTTLASVTKTAGPGGAGNNKKIPLSAVIPALPAGDYTVRLRFKGEFNYSGQTHAINIAMLGAGQPQK